MKLTIKKTVFANRANKPRCTVVLINAHIIYIATFFFLLYVLPQHRCGFVRKTNFSGTLSLIRSRRTLPVRTPLIVVLKTKFEFYKW